MNEPTSLFTDLDAHRLFAEGSEAASDGAAALSLSLAAHFRGGGSLLEEHESEFLRENLEECEDLAALDSEARRARLASDAGAADRQVLASVSTLCERFCRRERVALQLGVADASAARQGEAPAASYLEYLRTEREVGTLIWGFVTRSPQDEDLSQQFLHDFRPEK